MKVTYTNLLLALLYCSSSIAADPSHFSHLNSCQHNPIEIVLGDQMKAEKLWTYILKNLLPSYSECAIKELMQQMLSDDSANKMQQLQRLKDLYSATQKNVWTDSFYFLISSLHKEEMLNTLLERCPSEIWASTPSRVITAFELAGLSCKSKPVETKNSLNQWLKEPDSLDCWYDTDAPDAICSARQKGQKCPLTIEHRLSDSGVHISPVSFAVEIDQSNSIIKNLNEPFNPNEFSKLSSPPISLGILEDQELFSKWGPFPQTQNMPIKMPFTDYRLPKELAQFEEAIQKVADYWHSINPEFGDYYFCYLSASQSNVPSGKYQRRGHLHSDGFQSSWITPEVFSDYSFIVSNVAPTEFYLQGVDVSHLDPSNHNYYNYISKHVIVKGDRPQRPFEIMMMDSYTLHKAIKNETPETFQRTFIRLIFSPIRWDRKGNAHNPMFDYNWPMIERNMMDQLE